MMYLIDKEDGIILGTWMDNNVVTVASTCHGVKPITEVKRYSQCEKKLSMYHNFILLLIIDL